MVNDVNNFLGSFYLTDWVEHRTVQRVDGVKLHLMAISVKLFYGILIFISRAFDSNKRKFTLTRSSNECATIVLAIDKGAVDVYDDNRKRKIPLSGTREKE